MTEADRTTLFLKWAKARFNESFAFEAKICKDTSLPFVAVKDHQEIALYRVKHGFFNYKISDTGYDQKPFDGFQFVMTNAYVVIFWYQKRDDRRMTIIPIDRWMTEKEKSKHEGERKSLTYEQSCTIGRCESL